MIPAVVLFGWFFMMSTGNTWSQSGRVEEIGPFSTKDACEYARKNAPRGSHYVGKACYER